MRKVIYNNCYGGFGLSDKAEEWLRERGIAFAESYEFYDLPRHHPLLVECVETLGLESYGHCASLAVQEVDKLYYIEEYDGLETVHTPDTVQWVDAEAE